MRKFLRNYQTNKKRSMGFCTHTYLHLQAVQTTLPETKRRTCLPSNNQTVKRRHICRDTQLTMPNPLVTAAALNAELISNFHTSPVKVWMGPLCFFRFSLFSPCIINCPKKSVFRWKRWVITIAQ